MFRPKAIGLVRVVASMLLAFAIVFTAYGGGTQSVHASPDWWNTAWHHRMEIVFDNSAATEDLIDFPVLVRLTLAHDDFWSNVNDGITAEDTKDVRFVAGDPASELYFEAEKVDFVSQEALIWVRVPLIEAGSSIDSIYIYYGNPDATESPFHNAEEVWSNGYVLVHHYAEASGDFEDSTVYANDGSPFNGVVHGVAGQIGEAASFDGDQVYVEVEESSSLQLQGTSVTLEAWVTIDDFTGTSSPSRMWIINKINASHNRGYGLLQDTFSSERRFGFFIGTSAVSGTTPGAANRLRSETEIEQDRWYYVVGVYESPQMRIYIDGQLDNTLDTTNPFILNSVKDLFIGNNFTCPTSCHSNFNGTIDEIRVSGVARSADWIRASYEAQLDPPQFYAVSAQESLSATLAPNAGKYDLVNPADVTTTITWNHAATIDEIADDNTLTLIEGTDYTVNLLNGTATLSILDDYLASTLTNAEDAVVLTIEFDVGDPATFTITAIESATIDPPTADYDLASPSDVTTAINWGDSIEGWVDIEDDDGYVLVKDDDYTVGSLTILSSYLSGKLLNVDDQVVLTLVFYDESEEPYDPVYFTIRAIDTTSNPMLRAITVGGEAYPANKIAVLTPWFVIIAALGAGAGVAVRRRGAD